MDPELQIAACTTALPEGAAPEWVQLMPTGAVTARDGRAWTNAEPEAVIAATRALAMELPVDYEHQTDYAPANGQPAPAAGWLKELQIRADGIWGRVTWTARAKAMIEAGEYRFLSPVFHFDKQGRVKRLLRAALTNDPALYLQALARRQAGTSTAPNQENAMEELLKALRASLGLAEDADQTAVCTAVAAQAAQAKTAEGLKTALAAIAKAAGQAEDAEPEAVQTAACRAIEQAEQKAVGKTVPVEDYQALARRVDELERERSEKSAEDAVAAAIADGKLTPAMREWGLAYCRKDAEGFKAFVDKQPEIVPASGRDLPRRPGGAPPAAGGSLTEEQKAVCRMMGLPEEEVIKTRDAELKEAR